MDSKLVSLTERRRQENNKVAQALKPLETRVQELEQDTLRLIDLVLDMETQIYQQQQTIDIMQERMLSLIGMLMQPKGSE
jgi:ribosomal 50S subunit-associated protein YjgA (DUF615 family)